MLDVAQRRRQYRAAGPGPAASRRSARAIPSSVATSSATSSRAYRFRACGWGAAHAAAPVRDARHRARTCRSAGTGSSRCRAWPWAASAPPGGPRPSPTPRRSSSGSASTSRIRAALRRGGAANRRERRAGGRRFAQLLRGSGRAAAAARDRFGGALHLGRVSGAPVRIFSAAASHWAGRRSRCSRATWASAARTRTSTWISGATRGAPCSAPAICVEELEKRPGFRLERRQLVLGFASEPDGVRIDCRNLASGRAGLPRAAAPALRRRDQLGAHRARVARARGRAGADAVQPVFLHAVHRAAQARPRGQRPAPQSLAADRDLRAARSAR